MENLSVKPVMLCCVLAWLRGLYRASYVEFSRIVKAGRDVCETVFPSREDSRPDRLGRGTSDWETEHLGQCQRDWICF